MIGRAALALSALIRTAAVATPWAWSLPTRIAAPIVPADNPMSAAKVALDRRLSYDANLSIDGTMSCASCHERKHAFADGNTTRPGVPGDPGRRNVPGLANVASLSGPTAVDPRVTTPPIAARGHRKPGSARRRSVASAPPAIPVPISPMATSMRSFPPVLRIAVWHRAGRG